MIYAFFQNQSVIVLIYRDLTTIVIVCKYYFNFLKMLYNKENSE